MKLEGDGIDRSSPHKADEKESGINDGLQEDDRQGGKPDSSQQNRSNSDKNSGEDEKPKMNDDGANVIAFDSLNTAEKDALVKKLRREILKDEEPSDNFCIAFLDWIFEQFGLNGSAPPSTVLFTNIDYLKKKCDVEGIFVKEGSPELQKLYYESMFNSVEPDYKHEDLDVYSLARATTKYIKENVEFMDITLYQRLAAAYKAGEEKNYISKRLPFVLSNRSVFAEIVSLLDIIEKHEENNKVGKSRAAEAFSKSVFSWKQDSSADPMDAPQRKELFDDLLNAEFVYIPDEFYR